MKDACTYIGLGTKLCVQSCKLPLQWSQNEVIFEGQPVWHVYLVCKISKPKVAFFVPEFGKFLFTNH